MKRQSRDGTVLTTVQLPKQTHKWAKVTAKKQRMSMTLFIAELLTETMQKTEPPKARKQPA